MRLLDTHTGRFVEKDPKDEETVYAILSHTWDPAGEQTFKELNEIQERCFPSPSLCTSLCTLTDAIINTSHQSVVRRWKMLENRG